MNLECKFSLQKFVSFPSTCRNSSAVPAWMRPPRFFHVLSHSTVSPADSSSFIGMTVLDNREVIVRSLILFYLEIAICLLYEDNSTPAFTFNVWGTSTIEALHMCLPASVTSTSLQQACWWQPDVAIFRWVHPYKCLSNASCDAPISFFSSSFCWNYLSDWS